MIWNRNVALFADHMRMGLLLLVLLELLLLFLLLGASSMRNSMNFLGHQYSRKRKFAEIPVFSSLSFSLSLPPPLSLSLSLSAPVYSCPVKCLHSLTPNHNHYGWSEEKKNTNNRQDHTSIHQLDSSKCCLLHRCSRFVTFPHRHFSPIRRNLAHTHAHDIINSGPHDSINVRFDIFIPREKVLRM